MIIYLINKWINGNINKIMFIMTILMIISFSGIVLEQILKNYDSYMWIAKVFILFITSVYIFILCYKYICSNEENVDNELF